jgi:hypothetical protein
VVSFICDILHQFGFPNTIIKDLVSNFHSHHFWNFCECSDIEVKYVSVAHPRANGQVERTNGENSKKGGKWINEISSVVWGFRTRPSKATGHSPFFLVYGSEAILSADVM